MVAERSKPDQYPGPPHSTSSHVYEVGGGPLAKLVRASGEAPQATALEVLPPAGVTHEMVTLPLPCGVTYSEMKCVRAEML